MMISINRQFFKTRRILSTSVIKTSLAALIVFVIFVKLGFSNNKKQTTSDDVTDVDLDIVTVPMEDFLKSPFALVADDPRLNKVIRNNFSHSPSKEPYSFADPNIKTSNWQQKEVLKLLNNKKQGVFVECGAFDGEYLSNTLDLEMNYGWTGLLIEPDPSSYQRLLKKNRKAWSVQACLSSTIYTGQVMLKQAHELSKVTNIKEPKEGYAKVQCFTLFSILVALNVTTIDYFSLDIEGQELQVLKTVPWDKVNITVFSIEFNHLKEGKRFLKRFMENKGYQVQLDGSEIKGTKQNVDLLFYRKDLIKSPLL